MREEEQGRPWQGECSRICNGQGRRAAARGVAEVGRRLLAPLCAAEGEEDGGGATMHAAAAGAMRAAVSRGLRVTVGGSSCRGCCLGCIVNGGGEGGSRPLTERVAGDTVAGGWSRAGSQLSGENGGSLFQLSFSLFYCLCFYFSGLDSHHFSVSLVTHRY